MYHCQLQLAELPVHLVLMGDGTLAFIPVQQFKTILDQPEEGMTAIFSQENFSIGGAEFDYGTKYFYKEFPTMLQWLAEQKLEMPL